MTELAIVTQVSDLLFTHLAQALADPFIIVTDPSVGQQITDRSGMRWVHVPLITRTREDKDRDEVFYRHTFFPGQQLMEIELDGMPINRVLALDRFRFWHYGDALKLLEEVIRHIDATSLTVTLDINSAIPYLAASILDIPLTLIKTENIRTREYYLHLRDFGKLERVDNVLISFDDEKEYVKNLCPGAKVVTGIGERTFQEFPRKKELRKSIRMQRQLFLNGDEKLVGVIYDEKDNNTFLKFLKRMKLQRSISNSNVFIFPYTERGHELIYRCIPANYLEGVAILDDPDFIHAMDIIVSTRYYESVHNVYGGIEWKIFDPGFINFSDVLAPPEVEVIQ